MTDAHWMTTLRVYTRLAIALVLLGAVLVFASQNANVVSVRFLGWQTEMSLALLLFFALATGIAIGSLVAGGLYWRRARRRPEPTSTDPPSETSS